MTTEITMIDNPRGNIEVAQAMCRFIIERKNELMKSMEAITITEQNYADAQTKVAVEEMTEAVEDLRETAKKLIEAVLAESEAKRIITQIDPRLYTYSTKQDPLSAYTALSKALKEKKDAIKAFKDANKPQEASFKRIFILDCTESAFRKISEAITKAGIKCGACALLTKPEHIERVIKVIKAVETEMAAANEAMESI